MADQGPFQDPSRLSAFRGRVLDPSADAILDSIASDAAGELKAPWCQVSLILENVQLNRASHAPPGELLGRMTDRNLSICQFVVRDRAMVAIPDASKDPRVSPETLRTFNLGSYLGAPVHVGQEVVGSLCVFDQRPRDFHDGDRAALLRHAARASARLTELAAEQRGIDNAATLMRAATRPTFQDLRNALWQLSMSLDQIRVAAVEAGRLGEFSGARLLLADGTPADATLLPGAVQGASRLQELSQAAQQSAERLQLSMLALEAATQRSGVLADLAGVVSSAARLADHFLQLVGGLSGAPPPGVSLAMPASAAIVQVSTALATLALALLKARKRGALLVSAAESGGHVVLRIATLGSPELHAAAVAEIKALLGEAAGASVVHDAQSVSLIYRAASA